MQHAPALNKNIRVLREKKTFPQNNQQLADQQLSTSMFPMKIDQHHHFQVATIPIFHGTL
jgi:hypothetical protein